MKIDENKPLNPEAIRLLKHDIKNQLSNMILSLEQLRYEIKDPHPDWTYYMDTMGKGCDAINKIINNI